ncbi:MAG: redox-regulated ATPase YchF [Candidatus Bathyarchaeota archaeon]|nr:redox-regulated ATPase YchF [Candidatus Bathyarchaeota archaeon]MDI9578072.1 redox-regulated ATPase YchF [Thermoproteota archaeon]MDT8783101.1 redox-regulated ATPase YchF [Candidatus Bathyarchaeota archaeon]NLD66451.1 redox-regulated ATPase YchF [Thermoproteota archaeon]
MQRSYSRLLGIIGKPNTGKSTFFSAATLAAAEIANYPFTTIKPNRGVGYVRTQCVHEEFKVKDTPRNSICLDGSRLAPVELIDIAGIVPGAWEGRGLGNQFLDEICRADALIHIVDASGGTDCEGKSCKIGEHDPVEDVQFLEREITMWMVSILKKDWSRIARTAEADKKGIAQHLEDRLNSLNIKRVYVNEAIRKADLNVDKPATWTDEDFYRFVDNLRRLAKPLLIVANKVDLPYAQENVERIKKLEYIVIPASAEAELALRRAAEKKLIEYKPGDKDFKIIQPEKLSSGQIQGLESIREKILKTKASTGVQEALNTVYFKMLDMITVYPVEDVEHLTDHNGRVLPDVYLVPRGTTARQFAYIIHSELGDSFIYAIDARDKRRIGEDSILKDRDVISIVSAKKRA